MKKKYLINNREMVYCFRKYGMVSVPKTQHNYKKILDFLLSPEFDEETLFQMMNDRHMNIEKDSNGKIRKDKNGSAIIGKISIPKELLEKMNELRNKGFEWKHYRKFWNRCLKNPNPKSVELLFQFLTLYNFTITPDGHFLAYKGIRQDFTDVHTGTFDNHPGKVISMDRAEVKFDPKEHCACGLHCGSYSYASGFGNITVLVKVDPADVVSVPEDHNAQKIRVCRYRVESVYNECKDHGDTVVNKKNKAVYVNSTRNSRWTEEEERLLMKLLARVDGTVNWKEVARKFNRTKEACRKKYSQLKKSPEFFTEKNEAKKEDKKNWMPLETKSSKQNKAKKISRKWSENDSKILVSMHNSGKGWKEIGRYLGKTANACRKRFSRISK